MPRAKATDTSDTKETKPKKKVTAKKPRAKAPAKTTVKRTTTKKATSTTTAKTTTRRKAPVKKTATKRTTKTIRKKPKSSEEVQEVSTTARARSTSTRKAPTPFADQEIHAKAKRKQQIIVGSLVLVGIIASAAVGFSDTEAGQIDVAQTIQERNERMANMVDVDGPVTIAAVPTQPDKPDGGLIGLQATPAALGAPRPATPIASTTSTELASSTPQVAGAATSTATTTEAVATEIDPTEESESISSNVTTATTSSATELATTTDAGE